MNMDAVIDKSSGRNDLYHYNTWLFWLFAALLPAMLTRNPWYLLIILFAVFVPYNTIGRAAATAQSWTIFLKIGIFLAALGGLMNPLVVHYGQTVLFTLPQWTWRSGTNAVLLEVGGKITLEALSYGLVSGLNLAVIFLIFATFNMLVDHYQLLRAIPKFLYQTGMIVSIAVTFVPQMMSSLKDIREAQMIRGHRFRGVRDVLPLFIPLLTTGLERAIQLAESMEARGFGSRLSDQSARRALVRQIAVVGALFFILVGAFAFGYFRSHGWIGITLIGIGIGVIAFTFRDISRGVQRTRYKRDIWRRRDLFVCVMSGAALGIFFTFWLWHRVALIFYPYPRFALPPFNPLLGLAFLVPAAPVVMLIMNGAESSLSNNS